MQLSKNQSCFELSKQLCSKVQSRKTKLALYKTPIFPVLLYGVEIWILTYEDKQAM